MCCFVNFVTTVRVLFLLKLLKWPKNKRFNDKVDFFCFRILKIAPFIPIEISFLGPVIQRNDDIK